MIIFSLYNALLACNYTSLYSGLLFLCVRLWGGCETVSSPEKSALGWEVWGPAPAANCFVSRLLALAGCTGQSISPGHALQLSLLFSAFWYVARTPRNCFGTEDQGEASGLGECVVKSMALPRVGLAARPASAEVGKHLGARPCDKAFCRVIYTGETSRCWQRHRARCSRTLHTKSGTLKVAEMAMLGKESPTPPSCCQHWGVCLEHMGEKLKEAQ